MNAATVILNRAQQGDPKAAGELLPLVYDELRRVAAARMAGGAPGHTLQPTALVHEAWLRLVGNDSLAQFQGRTHFFAAAAEAMRHILIDHARRKQALRHGGGQQRVAVDDLEIAAPAEDDELLAVDEALERLARLDPAKAELVKLRYFVGMTLEEAAAALGLSEPAAKRRWALARAWLFHEISSQRR
jgi:RNA polymerase sigma factor (TIGR02999 family)